MAASGGWFELREIAVTHTSASARKEACSRRIATEIALTGTSTCFPLALGQPTGKLRLWLLLLLGFLGARSRQAQILGQI